MPRPAGGGGRPPNSSTAAAAAVRGGTAGGPKPVHPKALHLAGSMKELNDMVSVQNPRAADQISSRRPDQLVKSALEALKKADRMLDTVGDEEEAYVLYMRFVDVCTNVLRRCPSYEKDRKYYDDMVGKANVTKAIERSCRLSDSLKGRYLEAASKRTAETANNGNVGFKENGLFLAAAEDRPANFSAVVPRSPQVQPGSRAAEARLTTQGGLVKSPVFLGVEPEELYRLLKGSGGGVDGGGGGSSRSFMVLDARPAEDFKATRLQHPCSNVLNVPEEILLRPGLTTKGVERALHIESKAQWCRRDKVDLLIIMDWNSSVDEGDHDGNDHLGEAVRALANAMVCWESPGVKYQCLGGQLRLLNGGLDNFVLHYPSMVVNSAKAREVGLALQRRQKIRQRNFPENSIRNSSSKMMVIEYPDLDAAFIATPSPQGSPAAAVNGKDDEVTTANFDLNGNPVVAASSSGLLYPSTDGLRLARLPSPPAPATPMIPDRKSKPLGVNNDDDLEKIIASSTPLVNKGGGSSGKTQQQPAVDRSSKAKALLRIGQKNQEGGGRKANTTATRTMEVLEAEEELVDESLELEKKQLEMERRWELLRLRREKEAEEEMKLEVMAKEEQLLDELKKMAEEKEVKDKENADLRSQLEVVKAQLLELNTASASASVPSSSFEAERAIRVKEEERSRLRREVERIRIIRHREQQQQQQQQEQLRIQEKQKRLQETVEKRQEVELELARHEDHLRKLKLDDSPGVVNTITKVKLKSSSPPPPSGSNEDEEDKDRKGSSRVSSSSTLSQQSSTGILNRSFSSPNLAKMLEDEECGDEECGDEDQEQLQRRRLPEVLPRFDRGQKPAIEDVVASSLGPAKESSRNFRAVLGTGGKKGLTGLKNLGNTCYMNSILQCLSNFTVPSQYFISKLFGRDLNRTSSKTRGEVATEYAKVVCALWSDKYKSIVPADFKRVVGRYKPEFASGEQQDAHELLSRLIEWLHDDLNEVRTISGGLHREGQDNDRRKLPEQQNEGVPEAEAAQKAWEAEKTVDRSFIRETFYGQWRSVLACTVCSWQSVKYELFFELALEMPPGNGRCTLRQCLELYLTPEKVDYRCPKCQRTQRCTKRFEIVRLPHIIIVQFKRFYNDGSLLKRQNLVDFELNDLRLGDYATACGGQLNPYRNYRLYGVCNHFGSMEGGHYTAHCYSEVYHKWYKFDDHDVYEINQSQVKSSAAYILFYAAVNR